MRSSFVYFGVVSLAWMTACTAYDRGLSIAQPEAVSTYEAPFSNPNLPSTMSTQAANSGEFSRSNWHGGVQASSEVTGSKSDSQFLDFAGRATLECNGNCPSGIGLLLAFQAEKRLVARCTAFLVEDDVIATNSHCVPGDLKSPGSSGGRRIFAIFPHAKEIEVSHVIYASDIDRGTHFNPDYAFLKLRTKVPSARVLPISRAGLADGAEVQIWHVDETSEPMANPSFMLSSSMCNVSQRLGLFPAFSDNASPIATLTNCAIAEGNSGSPVLDRDGTVRGVLDAYFKIEETLVGQLMAPQEIAQIPRIAMVVNFSCIKEFSGAPERLAEACNADLSRNTYVATFKASFKDAISNSGSQLETQMKDSIHQWMSENSKIFRWKMIPADGGLQSIRALHAELFASPPVQPELDCVQPVAAWKNDFKTAVLFYKTSATARLKIPVWGIDVGVDSSFKYFPKLTNGDIETLEIRFNPEEMIRTGTANLDLKIKTSFLGQVFVTSLKKQIPICAH